MSFAEKLQQLRKANKMSQEQLADMLDVTRQSVSKWESGTTYPEMDKLIMLCKIFKCSLDDLTNDEITEINVEKKETPIINGLVGNIAEILNKSIKMIKAMSARQLIGLIFTMCVIGIWLLLLKIPFNYIEDSFSKMLFAIGDTKLTIFTTGLFNLVLDIIYFVIYILAFVYIYKVAYLDRYEFVERKASSDEENEKVEKSSVKEEITSEKKVVKEVKIIEKQSHEPNPVFKFLGNVVLWCIRGVVAVICIPFIFLLFFLFFVVAIVVKLMFDGVFFISVVLALLFAIILNLWYLETCIIFIFNKKYSFKRIFWTFIVGICGLGCSIGLVALELTDITIVNEVPEFMEKSTTTETFDMKSDLTLDFWSLYMSDVKYVVDENMTDTVQVSADYYEKYATLKISDVYGEIDFKRYYNSHDFFMTKEIWNDFINNIKNKTIYNYDLIYNVSITVTTSSANIDIIKENVKKKTEENNRLYYNDCSSYIIEINADNAEIERLNEEIDRLNEKIEALQEYKDRVKDIIDD